MKIRKKEESGVREYQVGGIVYTPYVPTPLNQNQNQTQSSGNKRDDKVEDNFTKEIFSILSETGLPNDVNTFLSEANSFLNKSKSIGSNLFQSDNSYDMTDIIKLRNMANRIKINKQLYDSASQQLIKERTWGEVAINDRGKIYVASKNGIEIINPDEYFNNKDQYQILTNSELLKLREEQPDLSYNQNILNDINGSVGVESIVNHLKSVINSFGTTSTDFYVSKDAEKLNSGFKEILNGPDGYYKVNSKHQGFDPANEQSVNMALNYLYSSLPKNMINILKANASITGIDPASKEGMLGFLYKSLNQHTSHSMDLSYDKESAGSKSGSGASDKEEQGSTIEMFVRGVGADGKYIDIRGEQDHVLMQVFSQQYTVPWDKEGKPLPQSNLKEILNNSELGIAVDRNSMYFGDQKINSTDQNKIVWDGSSSVNRVIMPYDKEVFANSGEYKPDFKTQEKFVEFTKWLENNENKTFVEKQQKARSLNIDLEFDEKTGQPIPNPDNMMIFAVIDGYSSSWIMDFDTDSKWLQKISENRDDIKNIYKQLVNYDPNNKSNKTANGYNPGIHRLYKSNIFMAIPDVKIPITIRTPEWNSRNTYKDTLNKSMKDKSRKDIKTNFN